ncbi:MAG: caspase family protein [Endomicrobia bacterium]|nr:caspase family protein [Endomicrobiia bacterium]
MNGKPLEKTSGPYGIKIADSGLKEYIGKYTIDLNYGENIIKVCARDTQLARSDYKEIRVTRSVIGRKLYLLSVGIDKYKDPKYNLQYAREDAEVMVELFKKQEGLLYEEVKTKCIVDEEATRENIINARYEFLDDASAVDVVVIFFAGHGVKDIKGNYYFMPHNADFAKPALYGLSYSEIKEKLLSSLPTKHVLFLCDSCHSGDIARGDVIVDELQSNMESIAKTGVIVISAATSQGYATEKIELGHGCFTYAIKIGLFEGKADKNKDGLISAKELYFYVANEVIRLSKKFQYPTGPDPDKIGLSDFTIYIIKNEENKK